MKDFKEQMNRAQAAQEDDYGALPNRKNKVVIAVIAGIFVLIILIGVAAVLLINNFTNHLFSDTGSTSQNQYAYTYAAGNLQNYSGYTGEYSNPYASSTEDATAANQSSDYASGSTFQAGTVAGTTYQSAFSGIKFTAPSNWTLTGGNGSASGGVITDLTGNDAGQSNSVAIMYYPLSNSGSYSSVSNILSGLKASITGASVIDNNVTLKIAGNKFTGFIYTTESNGTTIYSEVLGAEVNGYALLINVNSLSSADLTTVMNMFS